MCKYTITSLKEVIGYGVADTMSKAQQEAEQQAKQHIAWRPVSTWTIQTSFEE